MSELVTSTKIGMSCAMAGNQPMDLEMLGKARLLADERHGKMTHVELSPQVIANLCHQLGLSYLSVMYAPAMLARALEAERGLDGLTVEICTAEEVMRGLGHTDFRRGLSPYACASFYRHE